MVEHIHNNKFIKEVKAPSCLVTWHSPIQHISQLFVMMLVQTNLPHANHPKLWENNYVYGMQYLAMAINDGYNVFPRLYTCYYFVSITTYKNI